MENSWTAASLKRMELQKQPPDINQLTPASNLAPHRTSSVSEVNSTSRIATRIIIADDETIFRESLQVVLQIGGRFEVIGSCSDGEAALDLARNLNPDVLLLKYRPPENGDASVLMHLENFDAGKVILVCHSISQEETILALRRGIRGIILKTERTDSLIECISKIAQGGFWLGTDGINKLVQALFELEQSKARPKNYFGLTPREIEIVEVVMEGYSNSEIAANLSLSEQTVKHHLSHIFDKLGVFSRVELALAVNHNIREAPQCALLGPAHTEQKDKLRLR